MNHARRSSGKPARSAASRRGIASLEYLMVLTCVVLGAAAAAKHLGPQAVDTITWMAAWLALPVP